MLFISHNSGDERVAEELLHRALGRGYSSKQVFLDSDPGSGFAAGELWEVAMQEKLRQTRAMIVICSPNWLRSKWCFIELGYARAMSISIFPVIAEPCDVRDTLGTLQAIDLTAATDPAGREAAFGRLWTALDNLRLGPMEDLPWPPPGITDACPFPGLSCFDEQYAPVFFGREQERDAILQRLKAMRGSGVPRLLMIVGGSGSGKSSVLRAGVLPRLRDPTGRREWIVLSTLRYGAISNDDVSLLARLAEIVAGAFPAGTPGAPGWTSLREAFESTDVETAARKLIEVTLELGQCLGVANAGGDQGPTVVLAIDQFEELLIARSHPSAAGFLRFLRTLLSRSNGRLLVVGTMRSDYLDTYEADRDALATPFFGISLTSIPVGARAGCYCEASRAA
jgi:TIR domain/AAA ATPase domain